MVVAVVAEKPSVARDLARVLGAARRAPGALEGRGYVVTWAVGHLVGLAEPQEIRAEWKRWRWDTLPMFPGRWPLRVLEQSRTQFEVVRRVLNDPRVERVVCATDAGREGELIFRLLYEATGCDRPVQRLWISSLTDHAIREGFRRLRDAREKDSLAGAARARAQADWLVGMNLSRAYGLKLSLPLSVGRVQTPTLALVVERELAIQRFVPEDYLEVKATFSPRAGVSFEGVLCEPGKRVPARLPADGALATEVTARARAGRAAISALERSERRIPPPLLYDLTELQRHANRLYGLTAKATLEAAQSLYERHKLLSYPRTDSRHLSTEVALTLPSIIEAIAEPYAAHVARGTGELPLSRRFVDDSKVTDHHAILPTSTPRGGKRLSLDEGRVYDLVCRRLLMAWHPDHAFDATTVLTTIDHAPEVASVPDVYLSTGLAVRAQGWKVLDVKPVKSAKSKSANDEQSLPEGLRERQPLTVLSTEAIAKRTRPPPRLTDATLLSAMEHAGTSVAEQELSRAMRDRGLGTPATRAQIIETLIAREYIRREEKVLHATERGLQLVAAVDPEVKSPVMTGSWEARLQRIERGEADPSQFLRDIEGYVQKVVQRVRPGPGPGPGPRPRQPGVTAPLNSRGNPAPAGS